MSRPCLLHAENVCAPDAEGKCVCAPPGTSHDDRCATRRGHKCNCMVAVVGGAGDCGPPLAMYALFNPRPAR